MYPYVPVWRYAHRIETYRRLIRERVLPAVVLGSGETEWSVCFWRFSLCSAYSVEVDINAGLTDLEDTHEIGHSDRQS